MTSDVLLTAITQFGFPTVLVLYLLISFEKKLDRLISLVDKLTGMIVMMNHTSGRMINE